MKQKSWQSQGKTFSELNATWCYVMEKLQVARKRQWSGWSFTEVLNKQI